MARGGLGALTGAALAVLGGAARADGGACAGLAAAATPGLEDPATCVTALAGPGLEQGARVVAVAQAPDRLAVAVVPASGGAPLAGPAETEVLAVDPLRSPGVAIVPDAWLGGRGVAVVVSNSYAGTGRSMGTRALHLFLRVGGALRPVFAAYLEAEHSGLEGCRGRAGGTCRRSWTRRYAVVAGRAVAGGLPVLTVRDGRNGRVVSVHRMGAEGYVPARFDRLPAFAAP